MARYAFGGGIADWALGTVTVSSTPNLAQVVGGSVITFWDAEIGGTQYIDLLDEDGAPISSVLSADGSGVRATGQIPPFLGPDGVTSMWAQAGNGARALITALLADPISELTQQASSTGSALTAHMAATNPHGTRLADLVDVAVGGDPATRPVGQVVGVVAGGSFGLVGMSAFSKTLLLTAPAAGSYPVWRATTACAVTAVRGYRRGGTGAAVNAHAAAQQALAVDLSVSTADTWLSGAPAATVALAEGSTLSVDVVSLAGAPTLVVVQIDLAVA